MKLERVMTHACCNLLPHHISKIYLDYVKKNYRALYLSVQIFYNSGLSRNLEIFLVSANIQIEQPKISWDSWKPHAQSNQSFA